MNNEQFPSGNGVYLEQFLVQLHVFPALFIMKLSNNANALVLLYRVVNYHS